MGSCIAVGNAVALNFRDYQGNDISAIAERCLTPQPIARVTARAARLASSIRLLDTAAVMRREPTEASHQRFGGSMAEAVNTDELVVATASYLFQNGQTTMPPHRVWAFYCMISKIIAPAAVRPSAVRPRRKIRARPLDVPVRVGQTCIGLT